MSLTPEKLKEIQILKAKQFLKPLLYNLNIEEGMISSRVQKMKNIKDIDFKNSFIIFSDVQIYRSISVMGITRNFDRSIKYQVMSLSMLLDVWYSSYDSTEIYTKDSLRTCDILILHGKNDKSFGDKKASVLIDLLDERRSYGKITWLFIDGTTADTFKHYQPGVIDEFKHDNVYSFKFNKEEAQDEFIEVKQENGNLSKDTRKNDEII